MWMNLVLIAAFGALGGLGSLCIRLQTPGETFLKPPARLPGWIKKPLSYLTYVSDLVIGAVAAPIVLGLSQTDTSQEFTMYFVALPLLSGVGGASVLLTYATSLKSETETQKVIAAASVHKESTKTAAQNLVGVISTVNERSTPELQAFKGATSNNFSNELNYIKGKLDWSLRESGTPNGTD